MDPATVFDVDSIKAFYRTGKYWPTFPSSTLQVAQPTAQSSKADAMLEVDAIPTPMLVWPEQRTQSFSNHALSPLHQKVPNIEAIFI